MEPDILQDQPAASVPRRPLERWLVAIFLAVVVAAAGRNVAVICHQVLEAPRLPQWDMARRGVEGVRLAEALRHGDVPGFLIELNELSVWPPVFPLLEMPLFLVFGYGFEVPRLLVCALYLLAVPALFWAGVRLDPRHGPWAGLLAAAFLTASPHFHVFASLVMLEIPGALLVALCLGAYARSLEEGAGPERFRLVSILTLVLFFLKFNYALMWIVPLVLSEGRRTAGSWRALARRLVEGLASVSWWRPWNVFVAVYVLGTGAVLVAGGYTTEVAGVEIRVASLGSPLYTLYVLWLLRCLAAPRRRWTRFRAWLAERGSRARTFVLWVALPVAVWMAIPPHLRDFSVFVENRSSEIAFFSVEHLAFYPRVFVRQFSSSPAVGTALLVLALGLSLRPSFFGRRTGVLALALGCGAAAVFLHPYKLPRFVSTLAPLVWLAASFAVVGLLALLPRRARLAAPLLVGALATWTVAGGVDQRRLLFDYALYTVPRSVEPVLEAVARAASDDGETAVLGTWNLLSPGLLEWYLRLHHPGLDGAGIAESSRRILKVSPAEVCTDATVERVVALVPEPDAAVRRRFSAVRGFAAEVAPYEPVYDALAAAPCFELRREDVYAAGYRLRLYERSR